MQSAGSGKNLLKMGYSTSFTGELKFTNELTASQLAKVNTFLGADCRDHPEWGKDSLSYIDLELLPDFSGIKWDGSEKTYELTEKVNVIISEMQKEYPTFGLEGSLMAQGERVEDRWALVILDNVATEQKIALGGKKVTCPHCNGDFMLQTTSNNLP